MSMEEFLNRLLKECLTELRVDTVSRFDFPGRWSAGDLATDLTPLLLKKLQGAPVALVQGTICSKCLRPLGC